MTEATVYRGPDATAHVTTTCGAGAMHIGHNRLKIIDRSDEANQPFRSEDGRYLLAYNGEVYNYKEIRRQLQARGHSLKTASDTEVVLHLLILEGANGLQQLDGMFALAFYDTATHQLLLARDRFGIKPLYYADTDQSFVVSSEIKGILASGLVPKELNQTQLECYLQYRHALKPQTFYKGIAELEEGHYLLWQNNSLTTTPYCSVSAPQQEEVVPTGQLISKTKELLCESVQRHLVADVPIGLFLSGGVDSTLLLALLHEAGHTQFPAFSIALKPSEGSFGTQDTYYARLAAERYKASFTPFEIDENILAGTDALVRGLDQPIADGTALVTSYLAGAVKPHVKVVLSGAGADELFGGYNRHWAFYQYLRHQNKALALRGVLRLAKPLLVTGFDHPLRNTFRLLNKLPDKIHPNPYNTFLQFTEMDSALQQLLKERSGRPKSVNQEKDWLKWCLQHDLHQYLISDVLSMTDQTSMQHSLEVRTPYLSNGLHQYLQGMAGGTLFRQGQKWVLKEVLAAQGGKEFTNRPKEGFGMPLGKWLRDPKNSWLFQELRDSKAILFEFLNYTQTQQLLHLHLNGRHDYSTEVWALLVLAKWLQFNFAS